MKSVSVHELQSLLSTPGSVDLIDVRTPGEFAAFHVPAARSVPLDSLDCASLLATREKASASAPLYILCHSGARAQKAADKFVRAGFDQYVVVDGGTAAWTAAGLPVVRGTGRVISLDRQLRIVMGALILTGVLLSRFVNPAWIWLSAFVGCGLIFAGLTNICPMLSLISRMPWNRAPKPEGQGTGCCAA